MDGNEDHRAKIERLRRWEAEQRRAADTQAEQRAAAERKRRSRRVVVLGLFTLNGGLELAGSPLAASSLARAVRAEPVADPVAGPAVSIVDGKQLVVVTATTGSYSPTDLQVQPAIPTTLIVRAQQARGCVRAFVIPSQGKQWILPEDGDTAIDLGMLKPGRLAYSCGMGMYTGSLRVRQGNS